MNPTEAYFHITKKMLEERRIFAGSFTFQSEDVSETRDLASDYDALYPRKLKRCDEDMSFSNWLINGVFPAKLYDECGQSLEKMESDERLYSEAGFSRDGCWSSFFGRSMRKQEGMDKSFLRYLLTRFKHNINRSKPHFYFSTENCNWVLAPLVNNSILYKTPRTAVACVMNIAFSWDLRHNCMHTYLIMRSSQWSHLFGDIFGGNALALAIAKEFGYEPGPLHLYSVRLNMDHHPQAKQLLKQWNVPCLSV